MLVGGQCAGVLNVNATQPRRPFTLGQVKALTVLTGTAAPTLKAAALYSQVRETQARFAGILDIAEDAIVSVGEDQRIILFNQGAEKTFGYTAQEALGQPLDLLVPQADVAVHGKHFRDFAAAHDSSRRMGERRQVFGRRKNGNLFPAEASISKLILGGQTTLTAILRDITERKRAEAELVRLEAILTATTDFVMMADAKMQMVYCNPASRRALGIELDEDVTLLGVADIFSPAVYQWLLNEMFPQLIRDGAWSGELTFHSRLGVEVPTELVGLAHLGSDGKPEFFSAIARDITERRQAQESLRQSELQFRQVWDKSVDGMRLTDAKGIIRMVNGAFCSMVGKSKRSLEGKPYTTIYAGPQDDGLASHQERFASRSIEPYFTKEVVLWNGKKAHLELSNSFLEPLGQSPQLLSIIRDVTDQKNLESQLRQAQKMDAFGQLAGGVAHDFNNLLTIISGYSEIILDGAIPPDKTRELVREIRKAGDRAASLTRQLLAFSRKQMLQSVELDLNAVVADTEKMLRRLIGEDIDLATGLDPALESVKADPGQIEQVIMNLVVNARDAMPTGGHITIETRNVELDQNYTQQHAEVVPGNYVMLAVTDTGCGMDETIKAKIFEPFFTTKEVGKGTGLGLATVYGIVKQSGGSIEVYSELGHGTTFKVYLPRLKREVSSSKSLPSSSLIPQGTETILLAEDEEAVRGIVRLTLESSGYTVLAARNGDEALQICQQYKDPIHLLLTDVVMPKMSGRQLADIVVAARPNIKVLYLSGYTDDAIVRHGVLESNMAFLQKPFTPMLLAKKVREVLGAHTSWNI